MQQVQMTNPDLRLDELGSDGGSYSVGSKTAASVILPKAT
jgi:hypothetical protein